MLILQSRIFFALYFVMLSLQTKDYGYIYSYSIENQKEESRSCQVVSGLKNKEQIFFKTSTSNNIHVPSRF